ncbi:MAG: Acetyl-coenzyme A carboxylase carboxyl transferase subunit alpha [candidate division BRC1 bacterium ADurb.BinA364]|nr:MAG: Acetyl-coenzyme A carboxylase carboxyl transferase subunit alpha [candidate division BRC1 bacterium ADurb.BinA364]
MPPLAFEFEKPIIDLEQRIEQLKTEAQTDEALWFEVKRKEEELADLKHRIYSNLTPWQRIQLARHLDRPHALDYIHAIFQNWMEIHGDRQFGDDKAILTGFAHFMGKPVAIIGQQKGKDTKENLIRNFGMPHPEGYRKAMRLMRLAEKFRLPVIVLIDTPGAYPGVGAEERGQAEAIARNIRDMALLETPVICCVIGEGASGGALGVGVGDVVLMLENAWYCVIGPEACASILWRDAAMAPQAAKVMKMTAQDLDRLGIPDEIIPEPLGGAHRNPLESAHNVKRALERHLDRLRRKRIPELLEDRFQKYRRIGAIVEDAAPAPSV